MKKVVRVLGVLIVCFFVLGSTVYAQGTGPYFTASIGQSDVDVPGFDKGTSFSLGGGYSFNQNFAAEISYIDLGDSEDDIAPVWTISADGLLMNVVGKAPFNEKVSGFAKLGMFAWDATLDEAGTGQIDSDDGTDLFYGIGIMFNANEKMTLNFQYLMFELDDVDVDNISVGINVGF